MADDCVNPQTHGELLAFVRDLKSQGRLDALAHLRIAILRNITLDLMEPYLTYHLYLGGLKAEVHSGGFDTVIQDALAGDLNVERAAITVLALALDRFQPDYATSTWNPEELFARLSGVYDLVASRTQGLVVVNTVIRPRYADHMILGETGQAFLNARINAVNGMIRAYVARNSSRFCLLDWEHMVMDLGYDGALDRRFDYLSAAPFKPAFLDTCARKIAGIGRALTGKARKCLVLDCDGILWGGIVGEDGLSGIALDSHTYPGKAYRDFQANVINLQRRGVLLALCSRNNEEDVWNVLDNHSHCLIRREHIAAFRIDWNDKAGNIRDMAAELNIGTDSLVFVDDSPMERHRVKTALPDVWVPDVPDKPFKLPDLVFRDGLFDTLSTSPEDAKRTAMYQAERDREETRKNAEDLDAYLASLNLEAHIHRLRESEIARVAQLTQKTNQFNMRTVRYPEEKIRVFHESPEAVVYTLNVRDMFGDYGLTGVFIAVFENDVVFVDTLLLSCRVLGRKLEFAFVSHCLEAVIREFSPSLFRAEYVQTQKNAQVAQLWETFGFKPVGSSKDTTDYTMEPDDVVLHHLSFIAVITDENHES